MSPPVDSEAVIGRQTSSQDASSYLPGDGTDRRKSVSRTPARSGHHDDPKAEATINIARIGPVTEPQSLVPRADEVNLPISAESISSTLLETGEPATIEPVSTAQPPQSSRPSPPTHICEAKTGGSGQHTGDSITASHGHATLYDSRKSLVRKLLLLLFLHLAYFAAVLALLSYSQAHDGLWNVKHWEYIQEEKGIFDDRSLLWTTLPTLFFSVFALYMKWCYEDIYELLPFLKLYKEFDSGKNSVLVNYGTEPTHKAVFNAWHRKHKLASFSISMSIIFSIAVVPLSAHLFETKLRGASVSANVTMLTVWNEGNLNKQTDYSRALEVASVIDVYNNSQTLFSQWTDTDFAFPSFRSTTGPWPYNSTVVIPGVKGRGAYLDSLKFLQESQYRRSRTDVASRNESAGNVTDALKFSATDEGCLITHNIPILAGNVDLYFDIQSSVCNVSSEKSMTWIENYSRLSFVLAWPDRSSNATGFSTHLIVGNPVHITREGTLSVSVREGFSISGFNPSSTVEQIHEPPPFEKGLLATKGSRGLNRVQTNSFGSLILDRFDVARRNISTPWASSSADTDEEFRSEMLKAIDKVYRTVFVVSASLHGFEPTEWPLDYYSTGARVRRDVERLFVVIGVAAFIISMLFISCCIAGRALREAQLLRDWLVDRPDNLMDGYALLHECSSLGPMVEDVFAHAQHQGRFVEAANKRWTLDDATFSIRRDQKARPKLLVQDLVKKSDPEAG